MLSIRPFVPALLLALPMTFGIGAAAAETTDLKRVEVHGQRPANAPSRADVRKVCPEVDQSLQSALGRSWSMERRSGEMRVDFMLDGEQVSDVRMDGPLRAVYGKVVRRAMNWMECRSDAQTPQQFSLLISFSEGGQGKQPGAQVALMAQ